MNRTQKPSANVRRISSINPVHARRVADHSQIHDMDVTRNAKIDRTPLKRSEITDSQ